MLSYSIPSGDQGQNRKGKIKGLHFRNFRDCGALLGILCTKSMEKSMDNGKNKRYLHRDVNIPIVGLDPDNLVFFPISLLKSLTCGVS